MAQLVQINLGGFDRVVLLRPLGRLKYLTSTPYGQGEQVMFSYMEQQNLYQATTPYNNFHQLVGRNYEGFGADVRGNHDRFWEDLNKSDSEKLLVNKLGVVTFKK